jgi:hypothetical protein
VQFLSKTNQNIIMPILYVDGFMVYLIMLSFAVESTYGMSRDKVRNGGSYIIGDFVIYTSHLVMLR